MAGPQQPLDNPKGHAEYTAQRPGSTTLDEPIPSPAPISNAKEANPMNALKAADSVEVLILLDNVTDNLSSVPPFVETEFAALARRRRGTWVLGGDCLCCAAHGLSC